MCSPAAVLVLVFVFHCSLRIALDSNSHPGRGRAGRAALTGAPCRGLPVALPAAQPAAPPEAPTPQTRAHRCSPYALRPWPEKAGCCGAAWSVRVVVWSVVCLRHTSFDLLASAWRLHARSLGRHAYAARLFAQAARLTPLALAAAKAKAAARVAREAAKAKPAAKALALLVVRSGHWFSGLVADARVVFWVMSGLW